MNFIKEAENVLEHHRDLEYSLKLIERRIVKLKYSGAPKDLTASVMNDIFIKQYPKHDETINILCELKQLVDERLDVLKELEEVESVLEDISEGDGCEHYGKILKMWYIEKIPKEKIAEELFYSSRQTVYDIKNRALRKFTIRWFGVTALKAI